MLPKDGAGAEIGVWKGDFSAAILEMARPRKLYLIDPWEVRHDPSHAQAWYASDRGANLEEIHRGVRDRFAAQVDAGQVEIHRAKSADALAALPDASLDFVYIDGDHAYEGVRADFEMALPKIRVGGLICADDYLLGAWWGDGVVRAVNEFLGEHAGELRLRLFSNSQVVIERRGGVQPGSSSEPPSLAKTDGSA